LGKSTSIICSCARNSKPNKFRENVARFKCGLWQTHHNIQSGGTAVSDRLVVGACVDVCGFFLGIECSKLLREGGGGGELLWSWRLNWHCWFWYISDFLGKCDFGAFWCISVHSEGTQKVHFSLTLCSEIRPAQYFPPQSSFFSTTAMNSLMKWGGFFNAWQHYRHENFRITDFLAVPLWTRIFVCATNPPLQRHLKTVVKKALHHPPHPPPQISYRNALS